MLQPPGSPLPAHSASSTNTKLRFGVVSTLTTPHDASPERAATDTSPTSVGRLRNPPNWLWVAMLPLQVVAAALLTSYTYFFFDDFLFLQQARTERFGIAYLRESLFEHFSPLTRALNTLLVHVAPGSFALAHGLQLALYASAIAAFALVVRTILGNTWTAFVLTLLFGQAVFLMRLLDWWTATANTLPSTVLTLLAIAGYLRWRLTGSRAWLLTSMAAYLISLLDYETAMLFPVYLALISLLVLEEHPGPRAWVTTLWRERWAWFGYGVLEVLALYNYYEYYYQPVAKPTLGQLGHYLWIAMFETFVPALVGIKDPEASLSAHPIVIVAACLAVGAALVGTLYFRPRAWRCLLAFIVVFPITMAPVGLNRIGQFGVSIGHEVRYQQSLQFMFLVLAAFALSSRWGGRRTSEDALRRWLAARTPPRGALAIVGAAALAGYGALYVTSVDAMASASPEPREARAYVHTFLTAVHTVEAHTGSQPDLVNHEVPESIQFTSVAPYNLYSAFFGMFDSKLRFDQVAEPAYLVGDSGELLPVRFITRAAGELGSATVSSSYGSDVVPAALSRVSPACVPAGWTTARLHIKLSVPQAMAPQATGLPYALRVYYRMPVRTSVTILLANAGSVTPDTTFPHVWGPGQGAEFAPLGLKTSVDEVDLELPAGACVTNLTFGLFSLSGPSVR